MNTQMEYSNMRSEPSECVWQSRVLAIHLESYYFGNFAQEIWERNWMNPEMHTILLDTKLLNATLLNLYNPRLMETILKKVRERF